MDKPLSNTRLSDNFDWEEVTATSHRDIDNTLPAELHRNAIFTAARMEYVRACLGGKIILVSSWYRSPALNTAVGGSKTSDHMTGCAVDFLCPRFGSPEQVCKQLQLFKQSIGFKQLIFEHTWTHISWDPIPGVKPKLEVLTLLKDKKYALGITDKEGNSLTSATA